MINETIFRGRFSRTARLLGQTAMERLASSHVLLFGVGGVGGYVCEALVRSGIGEITLVDPDTVALSNINRQIIATDATVGMPKVTAAAERIRLINPGCTVHERQEFYLPGSGDSYDFSAYDYVIDAIDTVTAKLDIICRCQAVGTPVISAMGTGNKTDPTGFVITDISKTNTCPLASVMRRELRKRGVHHCKVVYSPTPPAKPLPDPEDGRKQSPASIAFVPPVCGLYIASEVVKDLTAGCVLTEEAPETEETL